MSTIRIKASDLGKGRVDRQRALAATEEQIQAWREEEGYGDFEFGPDVRVVPAVNVRAIREKLGLTQEQFATRYWLPLRSVQEWEQSRKQPSEAARVLLYAISRDPKGLERALRS